MNVEGMTDIKHSCLRKNRYPTKQDARIYAKKFQREYGDRSHIYKCKYCGFYHLSVHGKRINNDKT